MERFLLKLAETNSAKENMSKAITEQITRLEIHYAEQEHALQTLNDVVSRQDSELTIIKNELKILARQYQTLKSELPDLHDTAEKPPHY